jgi:predicted metal-dependent hydrolase
MAERKLWIENALARLQAEASSRPVPSAIKLPESIHLLAVDETWPVVYEQVSRGENPIASWPDGKLVIRCDLKDHDTIRTFLRRWLELRAGVLLPPVLQQVSQAAGLTCGKVTIRTQRTRWASCSSQNDISVNAHLLFFPPELVRYVFLHELCHTIHRNHSRDFYGLLAEKEPKSETYRRRMREAGKCIPDWARK